MANPNQQVTDSRRTVMRYLLWVALIYGLGALCSGMTEGLIRGRFVINVYMVAGSILALLFTSFGVALRLGYPRKWPETQSSEDDRPAFLRYFLRLFGITTVILAASSASRCRTGVLSGEPQYLLLDSVADVAAQTPIVLCNAALMFLVSFPQFRRQQTEPPKLPSSESGGMALPLESAPSGQSVCE